MQKSKSASIRGYLKEYRVGPLSGTSKEDLQRSKLNLAQKQSQSRMLERIETVSKQSLYKDISKKTEAFSTFALQENGTIRPFSNYMSLRPLTAIKQIGNEPDKTSESEHHLEYDESVRARNHNLVAHFERNFGRGMRKQLPRTQSAFNIKKQSGKSSVAQHNEDIRGKYNPQKVISARNIQSAAPHKQVVIEEEGTVKSESRLPAEEQSSMLQESQGPVDPLQREIEEINKFFESNPKACMAHALYELSKCREMFVDDEEETDRPQKNLTKEQLMYVNERQGLKERVELCVTDEPDFTNILTEADKKKERLLRINEKDKQELKLLLEEAEERLEYFKKNAAIVYDGDFKHLKVTQNRLTGNEVDKIKQEFEKKALKYWLFNLESPSSGKSSKRSSDPCFFS